MLDVRKLQMLTELERLGTITAVAETMHLTAPGVSTQLSALERELGIVLTERQGRRLAVTPAGRVLAQHGRTVLDRISLAELDIDALRGGITGRYRITAFPSAARALLPHAWRDLRAQGSEIELRITTAEPEAALASLTAGDTDLAVIHSYSNVPRRLPDTVHTEPLAAEPVWIALHVDDPVGASEIDLADLAEHDWIAPARDLSCYEMTDRACGLAGFRPRIVAESSDFAAQLALVAVGAGVALVPELTIDVLPADVRLARPAMPLERHIHAAHRISSQGDPGLDGIRTALRKAAHGRTRRTPTV